MKKFTTVLYLFSALSLTAAAQTVSTVTLMGSPDDPYISNHSGKVVLAAMVAITHADGTPEIHRRYFLDTQGIQDGATQKLGAARKRLRTTSPRVAAKLLAVICWDGEFRGEDSHQFRHDAEGDFASMRQSFALAKSGDWKGLKAKADSKDAWDAFGIGAAEKLLESYNQGEDINSLSYYGNLPSTTWVGSTPLAKIFNILGMKLVALSNFIQPTAYAQGTISNVQPYLQLSYNCETWTFSTLPNCPPINNTTPWVGKYGSCGGFPPLTPGVSANVFIDDNFYPIVNAYADTYSSSLVTRGNCKDVFSPMLYTNETWRFHIDCTNVLVTDYDNTSQTCGVQAVQYPYVP